MSNRGAHDASDIELETVNVRVSEGAATIELNRPQALNAWNAQFGADLLAALRRVAEDDDGARGPDHRRRAAASPRART